MVIAACSNPSGGSESETFIAVTGITGVPTVETKEINLTLTGTVAPANATNKTIVWSVENAGATGAVIDEGTLSTTEAGTVVVRATIANGAAAGTAYTKDFCITITAMAPEIHSISGINVPFRYVPAGSFMLRQDGTGNPSPDLTMTISQGYWMSETEVTQELYQEVMGQNPSHFPSGAAAGETQNRRPVERVNWYRAIAFCNKLSILAGKVPVYSVENVTNWADLTYGSIPGVHNPNWNAATMDMSKSGYRLPTEMEWMWAAMGADKTSPPNTTGYTKAFAGSDGSNNIDDYAWCQPGNAGLKTHEVGKKGTNELGLKDMSGNVYEWCWDWHDDYPSEGKTDYTGLVSGGTSNWKRVFRGGSHGSPTSYCAVTYRNGRMPYPDTGFPDLGIRVVCRP
jgi:formylglycine-generating enzyme required for sulfatase activity